MKIIYLYHSLTLIGGVERIFIEKMNYLSALPGYEVFVITYDHGKKKIAYPLSDQVKHIDLNILFYQDYKLNKIMRLFSKFHKERKFKTELYKAINDINPDFIITTSYFYRDVKVIIDSPDSSRKIIETHTAKTALDHEFLRSEGNFLKKYLNRKIYNQTIQLISKSSALVALTDQDAQAWRGIKKAYVIPNMLTYYPHHIPKLPSRKKAISVGRLTKQKGYDLLIEAWKDVSKKHPDWQLDIYGEGEDRQKLLLKIKGLNLENKIVIHNTTNKIYEKYRNSDFYIMSSRWEGFGLVLAEAMSCGIPCVSFNCPFGPSDIIKDGEDGLLVENENIKQLAKKICFMIENEKIRKNMGLRARDNIKRYLPNKIMPMWLNLFDELINKK